MTRDDLVKSVEYVVENSEYVRINEDKIEKFVKEYTPVSVEHWQEACPFWK